MVDAPGVEVWHPFCLVSCQQSSFVYGREEIVSGRHLDKRAAFCEDPFHFEIVLSSKIGATLSLRGCPNTNLIPILVVWLNLAESKHLR